MEDLAAFADRARAWLASYAGQAPPDYGAILPPDRYDEGVAWQRAFEAAGWAGLHWPVEHGGQGLTPAHTGVWQAECARAGVPAAINMVGIVLAGGAILRHGTPSQQAFHLRATLRAEQVWCQLFSEPGAGSDLASLATRAVRDGDRFVVDGQKVWCSGGRYSDWGILLARTDPDAPPHRGISFFLLDMRSPGVEVRPLRQMTGEAEFDEVFFTGVSVPPEGLLGPLHGGWGVAMDVLTSERGHIATAVVGLERRLEALAGLGARDGMGPVERDRLAGLVATAGAYRALGARQGPQATTAGSLLKLGITELGFEEAVLRADLAGAAALLAGPEAQRVLAAPGGRIAGGTSQIQRTIIGERLLGLPR